MIPKPRFSVADNWRYWDNLEAVNVRVPRNAGDWERFQVTAKRRALSKKELAASNGVYLGLDLKWLIPAQLVRLEIRPGTIITDIATGIDWTVLEAPLNTWRSWYGCVSRNKVIVHDLRQLIDIWAPTNTVDASGNRLPNYGATPLYPAVPGRIQPLDGAVEDHFSKHAMATRFTAILSQQVTVTNEMQVRIAGTTSPIYQIKGFRNPERIDLLMELDLEILP